MKTKNFLKIYFIFAAIALTAGFGAGNPTGAADSELTLNFSSNWSMISVPFTDFSYSVKGNCDRFWLYSYTDGGGYSVVSPNDSSAFKQLKPGVGYWLIAFQSGGYSCGGSVTFSGVPYEGLPSLKGWTWNLIGAPYTPIEFGALSGCDIFGGPWVYGLVDGYYQYYQPTYLEPGKGYWLNPTENCALSPNRPNLAITDITFDHEPVSHTPFTVIAHIKNEGGSAANDISSRFKFDWGEGIAAFSVDSAVLDKTRILPKETAILKVKVSPASPYPYFPLGSYKVAAFIKDAGQLEENSATKNFDIIKDSSPPVIENFAVNPISAEAGTNFVFTAKITDNSGLVSAVNININGPDDKIIGGYYYMFNDGKHGDGEAGDNIYGTVWDSSQKLDAIQRSGFGAYKTALRVQDGAIPFNAAEQELTFEILSPEELGSRCEDVAVNGSAENKLDIVFMASNYSEAELALFDSQIDTIVGLTEAADILSFSDIEPFKSNLNKINFYKLRAADLSMGGGSPPSNIMATAFLCAPADQVIILINAKGKSYSGSPITYNYIADDKNYGATVIHEFSHSFGDLNDEYMYLGPLERGPETIKRANVDIKGCPKWCDGGVNTAEPCHEGILYFENCLEKGGSYKNCYQGANNLLDERGIYPYDIIECDIGINCITGSACTWNANGIEKNDGIWYGYKPSKPSTIDGVPCLMADIRAKQFDAVDKKHLESLLKSYK